MEFIGDDSSSDEEENGEEQQQPPPQKSSSSKPIIIQQQKQPPLPHIKVKKDDVNMKMEIESFKSKSLEHKYAVVLLFPGPNSVTIDTFLEQRAALMNNHNDKATNSSDKLNVQSPLLVIVMDATWRRARRMANHFRKYIDASVPHIQLRPTTASIYARTQSQDGRICTIEALAYSIFDTYVQR